jgi:hypothetical protein
VGLLETIHANTKLILKNQEKQMTATQDLEAADAAIQAAIASAVTLIESLHTGTSAVADADVEKVVADLNAAASALSAAKAQA